MRASRWASSYVWRRLLCLAVALLVAAAAAAGRSQVGAVAYQSPMSAATTLVAVGGAGARFTRLAVTSDDVYAIDDAPHNLRRYILHGLPYAQQFTQVMRWKEGANGLIMGRPVDLYAAGQRLLILDSAGALWSYWGPDYARAIVPLRLQSNQGAPVALAMHGADLLLLDPARRTVWRYSARGGGYDTVPVALTARPLPQLAGALRLAVSRDALLALRADGAIVVMPWAHLASVHIWRLSSPIVGLWASPTSTQVLVTMGQEVALVASFGQVLWRARITGLGGEALRDVAMAPRHRLFVLTRTRILLVHTALPGL